ncbi:putative Protein F12F1.11 [Quillaja saponaria]|uniref:Uncharacterized protein n=1 Tax=Quillaja saponaria TaxID=32244 RepID=A0AAD7M0Q6_QUISA|nr:putative Protein F12F1.11 [Quillaja saponaria]
MKKLYRKDREVLAYLIFCSSSNTPFNNFSGNPRRSNNKNVVVKVIGGGGCADHPPLFNCNCFRCYMSYWVRWDESPNRQLIHEIIDAFEDWLAQSNKGGAAGKNSNSRKDRRNKRGSHTNASNTPVLVSSGKDELSESKSVGESSNSSGGGGGGGGGGCSVSDGGGAVGDCGGEGEEKGSVRKLVNFIGERIWGVWSQ